MSEANRDEWECAHTQTVMRCNSHKTPLVAYEISMYVLVVMGFGVRPPQRF